MRPIYLLLDNEIKILTNLGSLLMNFHISHCRIVKIYKNVTINLLITNLLEVYDKN